MKFKFSPLLVTIVLVILGGVFVVASNSPLFHSAPPAAASSLDVSIQRAETVVGTNPPITKPYLSLAALYLQKARETSDSAYYAKIDALMDTAAKIDPKDGDVPAIRASAEMGRHQFREAYVLIQKAIALNPDTAAYYGWRGDADIELGKYQEAVDSFQKMVDIRPDFSSWSRIAYIRELYGDIPGAKIALTQAISSGSNYPENIAWAYVELGKLDMRNDLAKASGDFKDALGVLPSYTQAMEGLGKVAFAKGDTQEAETQFTNAYNGLPLAQYAIDLGDFYGNTDAPDFRKATQYYEIAKVAFSRSAEGGVNTDLEESLFLSDHWLDLEDALAKGRRAHVERPSIYGADYLAWALFENGKSGDAAKYTNEALRLGQNDPLILFHQGEIALANGDRAHAKEYLAKAYALNPHFSVQYAGKLKADLDSLK